MVPTFLRPPFGMMCGMFKFEMRCEENRNTDKHWVPSLHRSLLNELGVRRVAAVVGGSMGGMHALEWAYEGKGYVCCIVAIATCAYQGAWAIGWGETQRHAIYYDPKFHGGRYSLDDPGRRVGVSSHGRLADLSQPRRSRASL